ncbi:MAG: DciA family protein [Patescibacteria group bacterium]
MLDHIDKLMPSTLRRGGIIKQVKTALVADEITAVLQEKFGAVAGQIKVKRFKQGIAHITCGSSSLAEEIRLYESELISTVNSRLTDQNVERLVATS